MENILLDIIKQIKDEGVLNDKLLAKIIHKHNRNLKNNERHHSKKKLLPYYLRIKETKPDRWEAWGVDSNTEKQLVRTLQVKPRRTASGVATITVITKPWKCSSDCIYCPNDVRMPKSYLSDEPACQRAERNYFDPYLQIASRLRALTHMGHITDKIELIILGGTWSDYSAEYQIWFITELFRALNDASSLEANAKKRRAFYKGINLHNQEDQLSEISRSQQEKVNTGDITYNQAIKTLYKNNNAWQEASSAQIATLDELDAQHTYNEQARHRVVGLVVETRPDTITCTSLKLLRRLGCTKIQMGIQSIDPFILEANRRTIALNQIKKSFELLRVFGFKIHAHFMVNLYKSSVEADKKDYQKFVSDPSYLPDEVKLYPCALVAGTGLEDHYTKGTWKPYTEDELLDILVADTLITPPFIRISRMIRDISAHDILAGNKKANLRQMVEGKIQKDGQRIEEIRYREISTGETEIKRLVLEILPYETTISQEYFIQWTTPENNIAGFLRLSLPHNTYVNENQECLPVKPHEAMIREVHVYGKVAGLQASGENAQHLGLGKQLIKKACDLAQEKGYTKMNVISSIGTREYYRSLGFHDNGLYQQMDISE